jgi:hypothetical protein
MKTFKLTMVAAAASLLMFAGIASACGDKASDTAGKAGCSHGTAACAKTGEMAGKGCCAKGASATTMAQVGDNTDMKTCTYKPGTIALRGTVLCNHCDLHKSSECETMFRTQNGCLFSLAGDAAKQLREEAVGGKKLVSVKGTLSDSGAIDVKGYRVIRSIETGASAM